MTESALHPSQFFDEIQRELVIETLQRNGVVRLRVGGTSMLPTIWPGDVLQIRSAAHADIQAGEIILLKTGSGLRIHRFIVAKDGGCVLTRGDSLPSADQSVTQTSVLGKVTGRLEGSEIKSLPAYSPGRHWVGRFCAHSRWFTMLLLWQKGRLKVSGDPALP